LGDVYGGAGVTGFCGVPMTLATAGAAPNGGLVCGGIGGTSESGGDDGARDGAPSGEPSANDDSDDHDAGSGGSGCSGRGDWAERCTIGFAGTAGLGAGAGGTGLDAGANGAGLDGGAGLRAGFGAGSSTGRRSTSNGTESASAAIAAAAAVGTCETALHFPHRTFLPSVPSGARNVPLQF